MSKQIKRFKRFDWLLLNGLQIERTSLFILYLGVTVGSDLIDGSDEMVHRELLRLNRCRPIVNGALI